MHDKHIAGKFLVLLVAATGNEPVLHVAVKRELLAQSVMVLGQKIAIDAMGVGAFKEIQM